MSNLPHIDDEDFGERLDPGNLPKWFANLLIVVAIALVITVSIYVIYQMSNYEIIYG